MWPPGRLRSLRDRGSWLWPLSVRKIAVVVLIAVGVTWGVVRFSGLAVSPPGFFMDEATPAVHAMCLAQTGKNVDGVPWPLYSRAAGGGHHPLTLLAFEIGWMKIFGSSRAAIRAVPAFFIMLTALAIFLLAREVVALVPPDGDRAAGHALQAFPWLALLAALVSPWSFQFGRVAWEAPLAPAFLMLGVWAMFRGYRATQRPLVWAVLAGLCAAGSMISYPPLRVTAPLVYLGAAAVLLSVAPEWRTRFRLFRPLLVAAVVTAVCMVPTLEMLGQGKINERMNNVVIWRPDWMDEHRGGAPRWLFLLETFLDNVLVHLRPSFLIFRGDASLRSSPGLSGQLSPLDLLACVVVLVGLLAIVGRVVRRSAWPVTPMQAPASGQRWLLATASLAALGFFLGIAPAALTFEAIPHALRALGAWPFVALGSGAVLALGWMWRRWFATLVAAVAVAHTLHFLPAYFSVYDDQPAHWFMREMTDTIRRQHELGEPPKPVLDLVRDSLAYSYQYDEVLLYYLMSDGKLSCVEAKSALAAFREGKPYTRPLAQ